MSICGCLLLNLTPVLNMYFKDTFHIVKVNGDKAGKTQLLKLHRRIKKVMHKEFGSMLILTGFKSFFFLVCFSLLRFEVLESMRDRITE